LTTHAERGIRRQKREPRNVEELCGIQVVRKMEKLAAGGVWIPAFEIKDVHFRPDIQIRNGGGRLNVENMLPPIKFFCHTEKTIAPFSIEERHSFFSP